MGILLAVSNIYVPGHIRKRHLETLFESTADAFRVEMPKINTDSCDEILESYAQFTRTQAFRSIQHGNITETKSRLFKNAEIIGQQFREYFKLERTNQIMRATELIYKMLKIELHGEPNGNITVRCCFFSNFYSSDTCRLISSLDEGLMAGLSGGGKLSFTQRITEGNDCCRAHLNMERS